ncbi:MAG: cytochrome c3 family protein [Planctomycetes bacterium]|nr:cytochrome c3 family protein [Planctomycetota bacterium]
MRRLMPRILPGLLLLCVVARPGLAQKAPPAPKPPSNEDCLACHDDPEAKRADGRSIAVSTRVYGASVHGLGGMACVDCHADLATTAEFPHAEKLAAVDCATCHPEPVRQYGAGVHAEARRASAASVAATCRDCHGAHDIRGAKDPESTTYHLNLVRTCGRCHGNPEIIRQGKIAIGDVVTEFQDSIHGQALRKSGLMVAPTCSDCHGFHEIKRRADPGSRVNRLRVPATCGACHEGVERQYASSVHGAGLKNGNPLVPECANCHSAHRITRVDLDTWKLQIIRECGTCHAESIKTYRDTFHGQVTSLGFVRVAACADCHGSHEIFPQADARSMISSARLVTTCQKCHPAANAGFAKYDPHADRENRHRNPLLFYAAKFMDALLIGVFAFFSIHTALWVSRSAPVGKGKPGRPAAPAPPGEPETPEGGERRE